MTEEERLEALKVIDDLIYEAIEGEDFVKYADEIVKRRENWGGETDISLVYDLRNKKLRVVELPPLVWNPWLWDLYRDTKIELEAGDVETPNRLAGHIYLVVTNNLVQGT